MSSSTTATLSFTRTHARYLASKVVTDLYQCSGFYGSPSEIAIADYEAELVELLVAGYVDEYEFGFKKDDVRVVSWRYAVTWVVDLAGGGTDDNAGGVYARAKVAGATYYNFLTHSRAWSNLSQGERDAFESRLPISRTSGSLPADGAGDWSVDRTYGNGGASITRNTYRPA